MPVGNGKPKVIKSFTLDEDLVDEMVKSKGEYESLSNYVNRTLRKAHKLPDL